MFRQTGNFSQNVGLKREQNRRKVVAFVATACACFSLILLIWPLTVAGFRSVSQVAVCIGSESGAAQEFQSLLAGVIRSRTSDQDLERIVEQVRVKTGLVNIFLKNVDLAGIRQSISVRALAGESPDSMQVEIAFQGSGTADERSLVRLLTKELADGLTEAAQNGSAGDMVVIKGSDRGVGDSSTILPDSSETTSAGFEQLDWLVGQMESDLSTIRQSVESMSASETLAKSNPFRSASHSSSSVPTLSEIQLAIEAIDTGALRNRLQELKISASRSMTYGQSLIPQFGLSTRPVGGVPGWVDLVFVGLLSSLVGSVVARRYQPFHASGFENVGRLAAKLRLPVIATIRSADPTENGTPTEFSSIHGWRNQPWANRIVAATKLLLMGLLVIVIGFCLISPEIRRSFLQNPFLGVCKMVWMFMGY
jgi:hypothetical protein